MMRMLGTAVNVRDSGRNFCDVSKPVSMRCVEACLHAMCRMPEMHEKVFKDYRRALVRRFPYVIFYEYSDNLVTVYSIFHTSRNPAKWRQKLP